MAVWLITDDDMLFIDFFCVDAFAKHNVEAKTATTSLSFGAGAAAFHLTSAHPQLLLQQRCNGFVVSLLFLFFVLQLTLGCARYLANSGCTQQESEQTAGRWATLISNVSHLLKARNPLAAK